MGIDALHPLEFRKIVTIDWLQRIDGSVVDENVNSTRLGFRGTHPHGSFRQIGKIGRDGVRSGRSYLLTLDVESEDVGASLGEREANRRADAPGCAGDQSGSSI
jgi:hypothetical protein